MQVRPAIDRDVADAAPGRASAADRLIAVGVDVVDVPRFARMVALHGPSLSGLVFSAPELATCRGSPSRLAARFAAKEAVAKALGTGIGGIGWRDVEVRTGASGAPELALSGNARTLARAQGLGAWSLSLSHDAGCAVAVVVALGPIGRPSTGEGSS